MFRKNEKKKILNERIAKKEIARVRGEEEEEGEEGKAEESPERPKKKKAAAAEHPGVVAEKPRKKRVPAPPVEGEEEGAGG